MKKIARILYLIAGVIFPIFVGALHTYAHFKYLVLPEVEQSLQKEILIFSENQIMWDTWGIVSFMMGMSFIVIGLLNISVLRKLTEKETPSWNSILAMIVYVLSAIYVGYEFNQAPQFYGGILGLVMLTACGGLKITTNKK